MSPYDMPNQHTAGAWRATPSGRCTFAQCSALLPLVRAISDELIERRTRFRELRNTRRALERSYSPEGLSVALADLEERILEHEDGILRACEELSGHGLVVHRLSPLVVHFPAGPRGAEPAFCWRENDPVVSEHRTDGVSCCTVGVDAFAAPLPVEHAAADPEPLPAERSGPPS